MPGSASAWTRRLPGASKIASTKRIKTHRLGRMVSLRHENSETIRKAARFAFFGQIIVMFVGVLLFSPEWGGSQEPGAQAPGLEDVAKKIPKPRRGDSLRRASAAPPGLKREFS